MVRCASASAVVLSAGERQVSKSTVNRPVVIEMKLNRCTPGVVDRLRGVLCAHPGPTQVRLRLHSPDQTTVFQLADELRVNPSQPLIADLKALLGPSCLGA